jgi:hypothetical protein
MSCGTDAWNKRKPTLVIESFNCTAIEGGEAGQIIALLGEQNALLEARFIELQTTGVCEQVAAKKSPLPKISGFPKSVGQTPPQISARRWGASGSSVYTGTPRQNGERQLADVAIRKLEVEVKRRETAEREVHRLRLLADRVRFTKRVDSPRIPHVASARRTESLRRPQTAVDRAPDIQRITMELSSAVKRLSQIKFPENKENALVEQQV